MAFSTRSLDGETARAKLSSIGRQQLIRSLLLTVVLFGVVPVESSSSSSSSHWTKRLGNHIPFLRRKTYTPLIFFKVPPGLIPECDAMERTVREIETELGVTVERLDILRNPETEAIMNLLTTEKTPPLLYHRESRQMIHIPTADNNSKGGSSSGGGGGKGKKDSDAASRNNMPVYINKDRVRAWAKGRLLYNIGASKPEGTKVNTPIVISQNDDALEQDRLDDYLTPLQRKGKQAIKERTEERAKALEQEKKEYEP